MIQIANKITGVKLVSSGKDEAAPSIDREVVEVEVLTERTKRPQVLHSLTYKISTPLSESAIYMTVSDIVLAEGTPHEHRRPFEVFINSKDMGNYQWVVAVTRLVSAIFRKGGDVTFILEELKSVFDPGGGYFTAQGRVPSLVAEIGMALEKHFKHIGLIKDDVNPVLLAKKEEFLDGGGKLENAAICPKCHARSVVNMGGCPTCLECGDSRCG